MTADIETRFERFHSANPAIYRELVALARQARASGFTRYSINTLFEVLRWHTDTATTPDRGFKLNNDFRAHYARAIMAGEPDLADFFEVRTSPRNGVEYFVNDHGSTQPMAVAA